MRFYNISQSRAKRVLSHPKRIEEGIAPKTIAYMQRAGSKKHPYEIWVMVQNVTIRRVLRPRVQNRGAQGRSLNALGTKTKIISVWRYPGITKPREIPSEILQEIQSMKSYV